MFLMKTMSAPRSFRFSISEPWPAGRKRGLLVCLLFAAVLVVHVVGNSSARFRMPWLPLIDVYASYALLRFRSFDWRVGPRVLAPLLIWLAFLVACVPYFVAGAGEQTWHAAYPEKETE